MHVCTFARLRAAGYLFIRACAASRGNFRRWNMAKKQLRTVKKSGQTGSLKRAEVRSAVIKVRDNSTGQFKTSGAPKVSRNTASGASKSQHSGRGSKVVAGSKK